jgi:pimeloyl-ACP methyl ester carboxylesterase
VDRQGEEQRDELLGMSAEEMAKAWSAGVSPVDAAALKGPFGRWLHHAVTAGLAPGVAGWSDDDIAFHSAWGFDPASIGCPVAIWHGLDDQFVPCGHGRWFAEHVPGARAQLRDGDGHLRVMAEHIGEVHAWLAEYV